MRSCTPARQPLRPTPPLPRLLLIAAMSATRAAQADTETEERLQFCKTCHRPGYSVSYVPTLDGQPREYLRNQLQAFKERRRRSEGHQQYWGARTEDDIRARRRTLRGERTGA